MNASQFEGELKKYRVVRQPTHVGEAWKPKSLGGINLTGAGGESNETRLTGGAAAGGGGAASKASSRVRGEAKEVEMFWEAISKHLTKRGVSAEDAVKVIGAARAISAGTMVVANKEGASTTETEA